MSSSLYNLKRQPRRAPIIIPAVTCFLPPTFLLHNPYLSSSHSELLPPLSPHTLILCHGTHEHWSCSQRRWLRRVPVSVHSFIRSRLTVNEHGVMS
ncbi:unnamed protein product [Brassica rapa]|uniref:Uncharacterized protein n=3 Tax=Brassica TaxID=3705 RepID=A0A8D9H631_BRACM|nr:unnamed protein product [Brassica napus]CAG7893383.1 unnamed protein product [Brassica rapa]